MKKDTAVTTGQKRAGVALLIIIILVGIAYTQISIFVVQPMGFVPKGRTIVLLRQQDLRFIDSADAMCLRRYGSVSSLCRSSSLSKAMDGTALWRMPYSDWLYKLSTRGVEFEGSSP